MFPFECCEVATGKLTRSPEFGSDGSSGDEIGQNKAESQPMRESTDRQKVACALFSLSQTSVSETFSCGDSEDSSQSLFGAIAIQPAVVIRHAAI